MSLLGFTSMPRSLPGDVGMLNLFLVTVLFLWEEGFPPTGYEITKLVNPLLQTGEWQVGNHVSLFVAIEKSKNLVAPYNQ